MANPGRETKAVFITTGNPNSVNDSAPSVTSVGASYDLRGQLGAIHRSADGSKEWIYCRFSSTSTGKTPAANQLVYWHDRTGFVVDNNTTASSAKPYDAAGVLKVAATRGNYVWIQRKNPSAVITSTATTQLAGDPVFGGGTNGDAAVMSSTSTAAPAGGIGGAAWFVNRPRVGVISSTTTVTGDPGTTLHVILDVE